MGQGLWNRRIKEIRKFETCFKKVSKQRKNDMYYDGEWLSAIELGRHVTIERPHDKNFNFHPMF